MPWVKIQKATLDRIAAVSLREGNLFNSESRPVPGDDSAVRILLGNEVFGVVSGRASREGLSVDEMINKMLDIY